MKLTQLRYFVAAASLGSLTAAARIHNVSQPALGYQLKELEEEAGVPLLLRHSRGVRLTEAGQLFFKTGSAALEAFAAAERSLRDLAKDQKRRLRLGVASTPGKVLLPEIMSLLATSSANLHVSVRQGLSGDLATGLERGDFDAVIGYDLVPEDGLTIIELYREDLYLVGRRDVMTQITDPVAATVLAQLPLVLDGPDRPFRLAIDAVLAKTGRTLDLVEVEAVNVKREIMLRHGRAAVVPLGLFIEEIEDSRFSARKINGPVIETTVSLAIGNAGPVDAVAAFRNLLEPLISRLVEAGSVKPAAGENE